MHDKTYFEEFQAGRLEAEDGILYHYEEPFKARHRLLRTKVVPLSLRRTVVAACHASPMAGHSGINRTRHRLATRFWWPTLNREVTHAVSSCAHCRLANIASHEAQQELNALLCDVPFDVVFLDVWSPGDLPEKSGSTKLLTCIDGMTGFADAVDLPISVTAESVAVATFAGFFVRNGLPRLIVVDQDGIFKGIFKELYELLGIPVQPVSPENHKAVRNERFHRYLNKVEKINTAAHKSYHQWLQGVMFALYAWNAGPIDGTDIARSFAAIGREFPFPIDLSAGAPREGSAEGEHAIDHCNAVSPLLYKQRLLLDLLNDERRQRHRELKNEGRKQRTFYPGDLVVVRKQVKSKAMEGMSSKLTFRAKGPYRVIQ